MRTSSALLLALVSAIAAFAVVLATTQSSSAGEQMQHVITVASVPQAAPASSPTSVASSSVATTPGSPTSAIQPTADSAPTLFQAVAVAHAPFSFVVQGDSGVIAFAEADAFSAEFSEDGVMQPVHPPDYGRAVWVEQSAFPAFPSSGASLVYVHSCQHNECPATAITLDSVHAGNSVVVTTLSGVLTYIVDRVELTPKSGLLPDWANDSTVRSRIVLVTCNFEGPDVSLQNIVIVGHLVASVSS